MTTSAWVLTAIDELQAAKSWTGRTHLHKLFYLAGELLGVEHPFQFELYRFGPYSFDLDAGVRDLGVCGLLSREFKHEGYGPSYKSVENWAGVVGDDVSDEAHQRLSRLALLIGERPASDLELMATCLWVERNQGITDPVEVVKAVRQIKPRYEAARIERERQALRSLEAAVADSATPR